MDNLNAEGLRERALLTGDVMYDAVLVNAGRARERSNILRSLGIAPGAYGVATLHRAENTAAQQLRTLLQAINQAAARFGRIVLPLHPRTAGILQSELADWRPQANLQLTSPVGYGDMLALVQGARWVLTDSGGLQKEAYFLGCPCVTLRDETEWLETLRGGANVLAGRDGARLGEALEQLNRLPARACDRMPDAAQGPFGGGQAAGRIVEAICELCESAT
jgi:UDP-GlcNAc3NAcA epimerase